MRDITAVILAGGKGTRIGHLLEGIPKPMVRVCGRPFLEWVIRYLALQGVRHVVLSTGYREAVVAAHFSENAVAGVTVECQKETEPLGTAGGFRNAARGSVRRAGAWLVLNGDSLALAAIDPLVNSLSDPAALGAILAVRMADSSRFGSVRTSATGDLVAFEEKVQGAGAINAGVYLWRPEILDYVPGGKPVGFEREVIPALASAGKKVKVCVVEAPFLDIGTPETLEQAEEFVRKHGEHFRS